MNATSFARSIAPTFAMALATGVSAQGSDVCGEFSLVPTPGHGQAGRMLNAIAAIGELGFAVGREYPQGSGPFVPILYRYNGAAWEDQSLPPLGGGASEPVLMSTHMAATSPDRAWVVGWVTVAPPTNFLPLILRWRNGSFDRVDTPTLRPMTVYPFGPRSGFANDVVAIDHDDVWALGQANGFGDAQTSSVAMALHWDGSSWEDVPTPIIANRTHVFDAASGSATDNVWAVGTSRNIGGPFLGFIQRWDGSSWEVVDHPALGIPASQFHEVLAISPNEVWVAGSINYTDPLFYRWDGSSWQTMPLPGNAGVITMSGTASDDIYAATGGAVYSIFHWNGTAWTEVPNSPAPEGMVKSFRGLFSAGECDVWTAGSTMNSQGFFGTFIEHLVPGGLCRADFDGDGFVSGADFDQYVQAFEAGEASADFDGNGFVSGIDFDLFVAAFEAGC